MAIDDETLMAFADGELTGPEAETVAAAIAADPALGEKVAQHRALRAMLTGAFDPMLAQSAPARIVAAAQSQPQAEVVDFAAAKERRDAKRASFTQRWGSIAAALAVGVIAGHFADFGGGLVKEQDGTLFARTELAVALDDQLASDDPAARGSPVRIGLTFRDGENQYCRTFSATRPDSMSGIACRNRGRWEVRMATAAGPAQDSEGYRMAGSDEAILDAAQVMMKGEPLDAAAEARARAEAWKDDPQTN